MSDSIEILRSLIDEIRLNVLLLLYRKDGLKAREILIFLGKEEINLPNVLYHLKILEDNKLVSKDDKKRYFITELGKKIIENFFSLEVMLSSESEKFLLIPRYPYIESASAQYISKMIRENFEIDQKEKSLFIGNIINKIKNITASLVSFDELTQLINSIYIEEIRAKNNLLSKHLIALSDEQNRTLQNLKKLIDNIPELKTYLKFINIPYLDSLLDRFFDKRVSLAQLFPITRKSIDIVSFSKIHASLSRIFANLSGGLAISYSKTETDFSWLRALFNSLLLERKQRLALIYRLKNNVDLFDLLHAEVLNGFDGRLHANSDLYIETGKSILNDLRSNFESLLRMHPSLHIINVEAQRPNVSCFGLFGLDDSEWVADSIISINLPRLSYDSRFDDTKFIDKLISLLNVCARVFKLKYDLIASSTKRNINARFYINFIGIFESIYIHTKNTIREKSANKFGRKVIEESEKILKELGEEMGINIALSSINDFESGLLFARYDLTQYKTLFPEKLRLVLRLYGYSSGIIPIWLAFNRLRDRFSLERPLLANLNGGYACEIYLNQSSVGEGIMEELLNDAFLKYDIHKLDLISTIPVCARCLNTFRDSSTCNRCGSNERYLITRDIDGKVRYFNYEDFEEPKMLYLLG